jgi:hypothetical protein
VYLISSESLAAIKVGITSAMSRWDRVRQHRENGWDVVGVHPVETGTDALRLERKIIRWWRDELGVGAKVAKGDMPQCGYTETAPIELLQQTTTKLAELASSLTTG